MKAQKINKTLLILIILGLTIRISLNNIVYSKDAESFVFWGHYLINNSMVSLFEDLPGGFTPLPPLYYYAARYLAHLDSLINYSGNVWISYLIFKIPPVSLEVLVTVVLFNFLKKHTNEKKALLASAFYFFNPALIYNTAVFGQIDSFISGLTFISVALFALKMRLFALLIFCVAFLSKLQAMALLPLALFQLLKVEKSKLLIYIPILAIFCSIPFWLPIYENGILWTVNYFKELPNWYPYTSVYTYNIWSFTGFIVNDSLTSPFYISYRYVAQLLFWSVSAAIIIPLLFKKKFNPTILFFAAFLLYFDFAFFSTRVHTRYILYSLPFLAAILHIVPKQAIFFNILIIVNLLLPMNYKFIQEIIYFLNFKPTIIFMTILFLISFLSFYRKYYYFVNEK